MMEAYTSFAEVYESFMDNIPYEKWCDYIVELLKEYGICDGIVAELGCGTGSMTRLLSQAGYDMIGIDNSMDMLDIAREHEYDAEEPCDNASSSILYLLQDMREFELYGTVAAVVSVCDSVNYITNPEDLQQVFRLVNNYLDPNGLFVFDFHPMEYYERQLAQNTIAEDREDMSFIWNNQYDSETRLNEYDLSLFVKREDGLYEKYEETHVQYGYSVSEMIELVKAAGMKVLHVYDAFTRNEPNENSERVYIVAMEQPVAGKQYI